MSEASSLPSIRPVCAGIVLILGILLSGCGTKTYEDRLKLTETYYDYIERLNRNLGPQFNDSGIQFRVPVQFQQIPAPVRKPKAATEGADEAAEDEEDQIDPRQPEHLGFQLPGLIAAWKANLTVAAGPESHQTGYLYLLGNYEYWRTFKTQNEIGDPLKFYEILTETLSSGLQIPIDARARGTANDRINKWYSETVPAAKDELFAVKKEFTTITLVPEPEEGLPAREFQLYLYQNGDMKIALLYDLPRNVGSGENLQERILLSLQTLDVSPQKPSGVSKAAGKISTPAPPAGSNF